MSLWFEKALTAEGWLDRVSLTIANGRIAKLQYDQPPSPTDECHAIALPGLSNLHSHAFQRGMAGLAECAGQGDDSFWTWREIMYRFVDRLDPEGVQAIAALAYIEMLESGFTRVGEFHYLHHDRDGTPYANRATMAEAIAAAAGEAGIGLTLLPVFYAHSGFGGVAPNHSQRRFIHDLDGFAQLLDGARTTVADLPGARVGVAPHSLRAVTAEQLRNVSALAADGPIHIHIAEQKAEVEACQAWSGQRPVEWLFNHINVDACWCLVHATHVEAAERRAIIDADAVVGLCPITEANLGDGLFPAHPFLHAGGRIGIGSDSHVRIDASEELRWLEYGQRLVHHKRNLLASGTSQSTGASIWHAALSGGGQALGDTEVGLRVGGPADMISLKPHHPALATAQGDQILDGWIFTGGRDLIDSVWRSGVKQVSGGRHRAREAIAARYISAVRKLLD
jgi:formimidoylglutamate deiminase